MNHLLLLHGAIGAKDQLVPLAEKLKGNFHVHSINFSGHGGEPIPERFSIELFATDVLNYLEENRIKKIDIFGYSMGGYVALYLAKYHPERVGKIFTLATKFSWTPEIAAKEGKMLDPEKIAEKVPAFAKTLEQRHAPVNWKQVLQKTAQMMVAMGSKNPLVPGDFESIPHPVIIGIGDQDTMVTMEETKLVCSRLKNGKLLVFEGTPHPIEKVDAEKLNTVITNFIQA